MFETIQREEIQRRLESGEAMTLVEALPARYYQDRHLPGAINIPHDEIEERAAERLPDKSAFIVVYCAAIRLSQPIPWIVWVTAMCMNMWRARKTGKAPACHSKPEQKQHATRHETIAGKRRPSRAPFLCFTPV